MTYFIRIFVQLIQYILGPAPTVVWCNWRDAYRFVGSSLFTENLNDYVPEEYVKPPEEPSSLYGDILNEYHLKRWKANQMTRSTIIYTGSYLHSPITYNVCAGDPKHYYWIMEHAFDLTLLLIFAILCYLVYSTYNIQFRYYASNIIAYTNRVVTDPQFYRKKFNDLAPTVFKQMDSHSHPIAAASRNSDSNYMSQYALSASLTPYYLQMSAADIRNKLSGCRSFFWSKDVAVTPGAFQPPPNALICILDVDQYLDMPHFLAHNTRPVIIGTVQPTAAAALGENFSFTFDQDSVMTYKVSGAAQYVHKVWNYNQDVISSYAYIFGMIPYKNTIYNVDRRNTSPHHDMILLTPIGVWGFMSVLMNFFIAPTPLKQLDLLRGTHNRLEVQTQKGLIMSTAVPNQHACANVNIELDNIFAIQVITSKSTVTKATFETLLDKATTDAEKIQNKLTATILFDYHTSNSQRLTTVELLVKVKERLFGSIFVRPKPEFVSPCILNPPRVRNYQYNTYDPDAKPSMIAFMSPIIDECYAPDKTKENEEVAIEERITSTRSNKVITPFIARVITEFLERLIPVPNQLIPVDMEEVERRQPRPSQRRLIYESIESARIRPIALNFMKSEAYSKPTPPRNITTYDSILKVSYSSFIYAISDWMKELKFYAFSKTPFDVANCVAQACANSDNVCNTDFSRFDGTISPAGRFFEAALIARLFTEAYKSEVSELHSQQFNLFVRATFGSKYNMFTARGSGSPETSTFNSLYNMFATFYGHRKTPHPTTKFIQADDAWERTTRGIYGGDDGLSCDLSIKHYVSACEDLGLVVKTQNVKHGDFGVCFLARVYGIDVWKGDHANCADLPRQLSKIHSSHSRAATPEQMLVDKLIGFLHSDRNTPVLGPLAKRVMHLNAGKLAINLDETTWIMQSTAKMHDLDKPAIDFEEHFPNPPRDWYLAYFNEVLPLFNLDTFSTWLSSCETTADILHAPLCQEKTLPPANKRQLVVDGELYPPNAQPTQQPKVKQKQQTPRKPKKNVTPNDIIIPAAPLQIKGNFNRVRKKAGHGL